MKTKTLLLLAIIFVSSATIAPKALANSSSSTTQYRNPIREAKLIALIAGGGISLLGFIGKAIGSISTSSKKEIAPDSNSEKSIDEDSQK